MHTDNNELIASNLWGQHTATTIPHYVSGPLLGEVPDLTNSYIEIKRACAIANMKLENLTAEKCNAIVKACDILLNTESAKQFPTPLMAGGGGTSTNMNVNEVIAGLANKIGNGLIIHPNDDVNRSQSSNDTYPTATSMCIIKNSNRVERALTELADTLIDKANQYPKDLHLGRTCLNDAMTLPISETHRAQAAGVERVKQGYLAAISRLKHLALGGTAVGTGAGAPDGFGSQAIYELNKSGNYTYEPAESLYDAMSNSDNYLAVGQSLENIAITIAKLARDIRMLSSGPAGGFGEILLPKIQAGSSIMPGKVNPAMLELTIASMIRVKGNCNIVAYAADAGEFEINTMVPVLLRAVLDIHDDISLSVTELTINCIRDMEWNLEVVRQNLEYSFDDKVENARINGYDTSSQ